MAMQYFNQIKNRRRSSHTVNPPKPVLTPEDEAFLQKVTSDPEDRPDSTTQNKTLTLEGLADSSQKPVVDDGALDVPLPSSPVEEFGRELGEEERKAREQPEDVRTKSEPVKPQDASVPEKKKRWSTIFWKKSADTKKVCVPRLEDARSRLQRPWVLTPHFLYRTRSQSPQINPRPKPQVPPPRQELQRTTQTKRERNRKI
jgi:hypothetical protein